MFSFVHKIVFFGVFPRAKNRALDRVFWCSPSCTKLCFLVLPRANNRAFWCSPSCQKPCSRSCFLVLSFVPKIVLFGALLRALLSFVQTSCSTSCCLVLSFVHKIVLFVDVPRAKNRALDRAFWCSPSCQKLCFFGALLRATNRAFWCFPSYQKSCSRSYFLVLSFVPKIVL